ncbi:hypothetical protein [Streptomyces sp. NPDC048411]
MGSGPASEVVLARSGGSLQHFAEAQLTEVLGLLQDLVRGAAAHVPPDAS